MVTSTIRYMGMRGDGRRAFPSTVHLNIFPAEDPLCIATPHPPTRPQNIIVLLHSVKNEVAV